MLIKSVDLPFFVAAFASFVASVGLWFGVDQATGAYVGLWVPSIIGVWCLVRIMLKQSHGEEAL